MLARVGLWVMGIRYLGCPVAPALCVFVMSSGRAALCLKKQQ
jgi:hypothetical protein